MRLIRSLAAASALVVGAGCAADSIASPEETAYLATLVNLAAHADAGSYSGITNPVGVAAMETPSFDPRTCIHQP